MGVQRKATEDRVVEDIDPSRKHLPVAKRVKEGRDKGLYDIPESRCLCDYAQGPCYYHSEFVKNDHSGPTTQQLVLWDLLR